MKMPVDINNVVITDEELGDIAKSIEDYLLPAKELGIMPDVFMRLINSKKIQDKVINTIIEIPKESNLTLMFSLDIIITLLMGYLIGYKHAKTSTL